MYTRNPDFRSPATEERSRQPPPHYSGSLWMPPEEPTEAESPPTAEIPVLTNDPADRSRASDVGGKRDADGASDRESSAEKEKTPGKGSRTGLGSLGLKIDPEDLLFFGASLFLLKNGEGDSWVYPAVLLLLILL